MTNSYTTLIDKFITTTPGEPFRLFPFGVIYKSGEKHEITPEYAKQIRLPHFKAPLKLGSHDDTTPAGGFIIGLEVREDGLYAIPEWNDAGVKALKDGAYRYHSPEILWSGSLEDPTTGNSIDGPLILGGALLHTPHLGEATAFYTTEISKKENDMQENISVPKSFLETLLGYLQPKKQEPVTEPPAEPTPVTETAEFKATVTERDNFKAELETLKAEAAAKEAKVELVAALQVREDYGAVYEKPEAADEAAGMLVTMTPEQREWVMRNFKALTAQINESKLTGETGSETAETIGANVKAEFEAEVQKIVKEKSINFVDAFNLAKSTHAELFQAAYGGK